MQSSPAARCQHIRTSGIQCGSPAMRSRNHCYYHQHWRPAIVNLNQPGKRAHFTLPILEDAHSIQFAITQVMHQLMEKTIDAKTAGLMLYGLQIASSNLRQLNAETPQPSQVVVDLDQVLDTTVDVAPSPQQSDDSQKQNSRRKNDEPSEEEIQRQIECLVGLGKQFDDPEGGDPATAIRRILPAGADFSFEALGRPETIATALGLVGKGGTTVLVGMAPPTARIPIDPLTMTLEERVIRGCWYGSCRPPADFPRLVELYRNGSLDLESMVSARCRLDEVNSAFAAMERGEVARTVIDYGL